MMQAQFFFFCECDGSSAVDFHDFHGLTQAQVSGGDGVAVIGFHQLSGCIGLLLCLVGWAGRGEKFYYFSSLLDNLKSYVFCTVTVPI